MFYIYKIDLYSTTTYNLIQCTEKLIPVYDSKEGRFKSASIKQVGIMIWRLAYNNHNTVLPNLANYITE